LLSEAQEKQSTKMSTANDRLFLFSHPMEVRLTEHCERQGNLLTPTDNC